MTFYVIRNRATGEYLSHSKQKNKTAARLTHTAPPRLFTQRKYAAMALHYWLQGEMFNDWGGKYEDEYTYFLTSRPMPERRAENMEIISVEIKEL
jgi:hypothetical protein